MSLGLSDLWRYDVASCGESMKFVGKYKVKVRISLGFPAGAGRDLCVGFSDSGMDEAHGTNGIGTEEHASWNISAMAFANRGPPFTSIGSLHSPPISENFEAAS